jgi:hypothetical protein
MRSYDRATYSAARKAWADGDFGPEWHEVYRLAADHGYIYPPTGTKWDDVQEEASQRAIVYQALTDNPTELRRIMARSHSWHDVVRQVIAFRGVLRDQADLLDADAQWEKRDRPPRAAVPEATIAILRRIVA